MNIDGLDIPWFVLGEADAALPDVTWHRICHESEFGPVEVAVLQSFQDCPHTHRRRRMAYLMVAALALYEALQELFQLFEEHQPAWYLRGHYNLAANALTGTEPPGEAA